jgi:hypothetical protein
MMTCLHRSPDAGTKATSPVYRCGNNYSSPYLKYMSSSSNTSAANATRYGNHSMVNSTSNSTHSVPSDGDSDGEPTNVTEIDTLPAVSMKKSADADADSVPADQQPAGMMPFNWGKTMPGGEKANGKGIDGGMFGPQGTNGGKVRLSACVRTYIYIKREIYINSDRFRYAMLTFIYLSTITVAPFSLARSVAASSTAPNCVLLTEHLSSNHMPGWMSAFGCVA